MSTPLRKLIMAEAGTDEIRDQAIAEGMLTLRMDGWLKVLKGAIDPGRDWKTQVEHAMGAYLGCLASNPALLRTLFIDILGLGPEGLQVRRQMNQELADFVVQVVHAGHRHSPQDAALTAAMAMAVVGGINELVLQAIEGNRTAELAALTPACSALVRAVLAAPR